LKKFLIALLFLAFVFESKAQTSGNNDLFPSIHFSALAGPNFTFPFQTGYLAQFEARTKVSSCVSIKASVGLSSIYEDFGNYVSTYSYTKIAQTDIYQSYSYKLDKYEYSIVPLSLGVEYSFSENIGSPFLLAELGYNLYSVEMHKSNQVLGAGGTFSTKAQLPEQYRQEPPKIKDDTSFRIGLGAGMRFRISGNFYFEARYIYNVNTQLINSHQILMGISI